MNTFSQSCPVNLKRNVVYEKQSVLLGRWEGGGDWWVDHIHNFRTDSYAGGIATSRMIILSHFLFR